MLAGAQVAVLPLRDSRTSPISAVDVASALAVMLDDPAPHVGQVYNLTGFESASVDHYARAFSEVLGRPIRYLDIPLGEWTERLRQAGVPAHLLAHLVAMSELHGQGRYDRMTDDFSRLTGRAPIDMRAFVQRNAAAFARQSTD
ncbi:hypothetical protein ACFPOA_09045 [Lysobacter niabensis]|uniref:hypothetical protein n=1 Tax=Agrilutibacter niabensis TaxID=380628 RepID=UPI003618005F